MKPLVMGVVNVTPDSFSDGDPDPDTAIAHGLQLLRDGADLLDIGGEATNPRAQAISAEDELARVLPVVRELARHATVSIDTTKAAVARVAVSAGARIVNDVSGGLFDPEIMRALGGATYICGHLRGRSIAEVFAAEQPVTWQDVAADLAARLAELPAGVEAWIDPGLGFGKGADPATNEALLEHAGDLARRLGRKVVVGPSRKRFLRRRLVARGVAAPTTADLDAETVTACLTAARAGAHVLRVHNVTLLNAALTTYNKE